MFEKQHPGGYEKVFTHFTTATDSQNIRNVFEDVREIIVQKMLENEGIFFTI